MTEQNFDVVVIGAGPGGYVAAIRAAQLGLKVACVEKRKTLGGTCLNVGCIPSKALLEISHKFHDAKHQFEKLGITFPLSGIESTRQRDDGGANNQISKPKIDVKKLLQNKNEIVSGLTQGIAGLLKKNKVTSISGTAKFLDKNSIEVIFEDGKKEKVSAKNFIIATGSEVTKLPGVEIDEKVIVSSTGALELEKVPQKMIVIGAGVIGLELGSVWGRFGAEIEVIEFLDKITPTMDAEVSRNFQRILEKQGFKFRLSTKVISVKKDKNVAKVEVESVADGKKETLSADVVLVAIGRRPNTENLGLENAGVKINARGFIENNHLRTNVENIFVVGDVTTGAMLAHKAEDEGVAAAEIIAGQAGHVNYDCIPSVVYTYPEIASVGKTEEELKAAGIAYKVGKFSMMANSRARATFDEQGFVKILSCAKTDRILGAHIIAREAGNTIHEIVVAMEFGGSAEDIARTCHAHPTYNEAVKEAALAVDKRAIHS
jgi:dihydrolipoamide dehydrogenase